MCKESCSEHSPSGCCRLPASYQCPPFQWHSEHSAHCRIYLQWLSDPKANLSQALSAVLLDGCLTQGCFPHCAGRLLFKDRSTLRLAELETRYGPIIHLLQLSEGLPKHLDAEEAVLLHSSHICASRVNQKPYAVWPWSSQVYSRYCSTAEALGWSVPCTIPATTGHCFITLRFIFCVFQKAHEHDVQTEI